MKRLSLTAIPIILVLIISGCTAPGSQPPVGDSQSDQQQALSEIDLLLQQAEGASPLVRAEYTLQASEQLLAEQQTERALLLLDSINIAILPSASQQLYWLLRAQAANLQQQPERMLEYLAQISQPQLLSAQQQTLLSQLNISGQTQLGDYSALLNQLIESSAMTLEVERLPINNQIWSLLSQYSVEQLKDMAQQPENSFLQQGWYDLALNIRSAGLDIIQGLQSLRHWQQLWSLHPAAAVLPDAITSLISQDVERPQHIAVLLPQSGDLAKAGQTIIEGILAAHFEDQQLGLAVPKISFYDTEKIDNLFDFYFTASTEGVDLVIGPLSKARVSSLTDLPNVSIPTLALNYGQDSHATLDLYQFGLRGEDEAEQAARFAWKQGYRRALSLTADTSWGQRIEETFKQQWLALGGTLSAEQNFGSDGFSAAISNMLAVDSSEERYKELRSFLSEKAEFEPRRRQDADFIFLSALAKDARQLKPILAFHYAANLPVIATSHVYTGTPAADKDQDLNGIAFSTTPWVLNPNSPLRSRIETYRQDTQSRFGRLYALGADAYRLAPYLQQLQEVQGAYLSGNTGHLSINTQGDIIRQLNWAQFQDGEARELPKEP